MYDNVVGSFPTGRMANDRQGRITGDDRRTLRELAKQVAEIGHLPEQADRRTLWKRHNRLERVKPIVLVFPEGSWEELLPWSTLVCHDLVCREYEYVLRHIIYRWRHLRDDSVIEPRVTVPLICHNSGWGIEPTAIVSEGTRSQPYSGPPAGVLDRAPSLRRTRRSTTALKYDPPLKAPSDISRMRMPQLTVDWPETRRRFDLISEAIGDILDVRIKKLTRFDTGLIDRLALLRGADQLMIDMCLQPEWVHEAMTFMCEGTERLLDQAEAMNLLDLNNEDDYVGSGGYGYTDELPAAGHDHQQVRTTDLWGFATAQQLAHVSPAMHEEFAARYQARLLSRFGLNCYGCCESLTAKWDIVKAIPRLRRASVSPWADVWAAAEALQDRVILSWKPNPADILLSDYETVIRQRIDDALDAARGCVLEIVLKDTHTCYDQPERIQAWVRIANEMTAEGYR